MESHRISSIMMGIKVLEVRSPLFQDLEEDIVTKDLVAEELINWRDLPET